MNRLVEMRKGIMMQYYNLIYIFYENYNPYYRHCENSVPIHSKEGKDGGACSREKGRR